VEHFEQQMWFLRNFGFRPISIDEFYQIKIGNKKPRGKEVLVTFDDGNETYLQYALPILERYQIPSVNFLVWVPLVKKEHGSMSLEAAKHFAGHPLITFGVHSLTHPNLAEINYEQAKAEIIDSKRNLEEALGKPMHYFTYPSGFFNDQPVELVRQAGYRLAFTTSGKHLRGRPETIYTIKRIKIPDKYNLLAFWFAISGVRESFKRIAGYFHQLTVNKQNDKLSTYESAPAAM
jgi:peptidoglycan/xylan/chitin deacetylase (PgdA/CDA1 family)